MGQHSIDQRLPMTRVDAAWLHLEQPNNLMMITGVLMFDQPVDWQRLRGVIRERLLQPYPRFLMRPDNPHKSIATTYWESVPNLDIEEHIDHVELPAPGGQRELEALVSRAMSTRLDLRQPLWHFYFVDGFGDGCAVLVRLHHAIADGIALARILISLTDPETGDSVDKILAGGDQAGLRSLRNARDEAERSLLRRAAEIAKIAAASAVALKKLLLSLPDKRTIFKGKLAVGKSAAWTRGFPLDEIKALGKARGYTINDTLIAAVTGALRHYLIEHNSGVSEIRAAVPVNLRPLDGPIEMGNLFGLVFLSLPVGVDNPGERIHQIHDEMEAIKRSPEAIVALGLLRILGLMPPALERRIMQMFGKKASLVLTNVPGPRQQIYLAGVPLRSLMFWVPQSGGLGLGVSIISYNEEVFVGIASDSRLVPDPLHLVDLVEGELERMLITAKVAA